MIASDKMYPGKLLSLQVNNRKGSVSPCLGDPKEIIRVIFLDLKTRSRSKCQNFQALMVK